MTTVHACFPSSFLLYFFHVMHQIISWICPREGILFSFFVLVPSSFVFFPSFLLSKSSRIPHRFVSYRRDIPLRTLDSYFVCCVKWNFLPVHRLLWWAFLARCKTTLNMASCLLLYYEFVPQLIYTVALTNVEEILILNFFTPQKDNTGH